MTLTDTATSRPTVIRLPRLIAIGLAGAGLFLLPSATKAAAPATLPPIRLTPKPVDSAIERRARSQPTVPEGAKEVPYVETAPEPVLTDDEKARG